MDKKALEGMDPKLKAAYDKVMGTQITPHSPSQHAPEKAATASGTFHEVPMVKKEEGGGMSYNAANNKAAGKKSSISWPVIVGLAVVFLLLYTVVWAKILNTKLPFLPF